MQTNQTHRLYWLTFVIALLLGAFPTLAQGQQEKLNGYAEYNRNGVLIVEGQRVRADQRTKFKKVADLMSIPLGYEVKVKGTRLNDGSILTQEVEAKPNGSAMFEQETRQGHAQAEQVWMHYGMRLKPAQDGSVEADGRIISDGPQVARLQRIVNRLLPPYVSPAQVRVRIIEHEDWNASAMANGAIWVHSSLVRDMSDDELAVILGHELAHFTHEHSRRRMKQGLLGQAVAAGVQGALENNPNAQAQAQPYMNLAMAAWQNGYSRENEDQSDRVGLRYAYEGGFDVARGFRVWERFLQRYGEADAVKNFFHGSHSRPSDRLRNLQTEVQLNYSGRR